jgi:hypothetical protein
MCQKIVVCRIIFTAVVLKYMLLYGAENVVTVSNGLTKVSQGQACLFSAQRLYTAVTLDKPSKARGLPLQHLCASESIRFHWTVRFLLPSMLAQNLLARVPFRISTSFSRPPSASRHLEV